MPSASYIRKRKEIQKKRSKLGVEARRRKMRENAAERTVTSTLHTEGVIGDHVIELLTSPDDPLQMLVRFDGEIRRPRTVAGFNKLLGEYLWKEANR